MAEETKAIAGFGLEYVSSDVSVLSGDFAVYSLSRKRLW
jgi:hypothetical protein